MTMSAQTRNWLHGLGAAFIGGLASAIDSGLALMIMAPDKFNLSAGLKTTLETTLILGVLTGIKVAAAYLKQSPLPSEETVLTSKTETKTTLTQQGNP